jgi:integrin alpha FG-GAP repeat containing protein 1
MRQRRAHWRPYAVLSVLACMGHAASAAWWPFPPKRFAGNGLLPAGPLGLDTEERVIAFGDFNGDQ